MKNQPQLTHWFTEKKFRCPCFRNFAVLVVIATDGRTEWADCPRCGKQWTVPCNFDEDYS